MRTEINVAPTVMDWALGHMDTSMINENLLDNAEKWRTGKKRPTFNQLESLSRASGIPFGYFFLQTPPKEDLSLLQYRTVDSIQLQNPSRNLVDTIHDMENVQDWMRNYLLENGHTDLGFVGSQKDKHNAVQIAGAIRKDLGLSVNWYADSKSALDSFNKIRMFAESSNILIMMNGVVGSNTHRKLDINEFRAFTLIDNYAPLVFINANDSNNGRLFSIIHEISHIWLGYNSFYNDRYNTAFDISAVEQLCNAVAGEILVPQQSFKKRWNSVIYGDFKERIKEVASYYKCGTTVIARKALANNFITAKQYKECAEEAIKYYEEFIKQKRNYPGGNYYKTMASRIDHRFLYALYNDVSEGRTRYTDAFNLTHTNRDTFEKLFEKIRGVYNG